MESRYGGGTGDGLEPIPSVLSFPDQSTPPVWRCWKIITIV